MAKIENVSNGPREIHALRTGTKYVISAGRISDDGRQTRINGTGEIPDDVLNELLEKDAFTQGLFANGGDLVRVGAPTPATVAPPAPPPPAPPAPPAEDDKGKAKAK